MRAALVMLLVSGAAWSQTPAVGARPGVAAPRFELSLQPVRAQVNGKFTQHFGSFGVASWFPRERVAVQLIGGANWVNEESGFNQELVEKFRVEAQAASSLLWTWGLFTGVELEPFVGEFSLVQGTRLRLGVVLGLAGGPGGTRHQLKPQTVRTDGSVSAATFGDTGVRFMATVAAGLRLRLGERFTARLEVRDVGFNSAVGSVNGCSGADLRAIASRTDLILRDPGSTHGLSASCMDFPAANQPDAWTALSLTQRSTSDITHNLGVALSAGVTF